MYSSERKPSPQRQGSVTASAGGPTTASAQAAGSEAHLRVLQRELGNQAVGRLLRAGSLPGGLQVSRRGDRYEQEATRLASWMVQGPTPRAEPVEEAAAARKVALSPAGGGGDGEVQAEAGPGRPLPPRLRARFEAHLGADLGAVRLHTGPDAAAAAQAFHARAFALGHDVVLGEGQYRPGSAAGQRLLAHEVTHVVQQGVHGAPDPAVSVRSSQTPVLARDKETGGTQSVEFLRAGWVDVNDLGIVYQPGPEPDGGARLRELPDKDSKKLRWLPQNTKVFILRHHPTDRWYAVTVLGPGGGQFGYIADWLLMRNLPDPDADVLKLKPGDTPLDVAREHYAHKGFNVWGKDPRYVVNALVWVNQRAKHNFPGESGIKKPSVDEAWWTASSTAGVYIWLPGPDFLNAIYEQVAEHGGGTGSISADLWRSVKKIYKYVAYGLAFVGGLVHGFVKSLWDAVAGLVETVIDVLVSVFTGNVVKDARELWETIQKLTWEDIKNSLADWWQKWEKKLTSDSPWVAGHAHGYLTGYIMAEAAQLLLTAGAAAAAKSAIMASRVGKAIQATRAYRAFAKGIETVGETGSKARKLVGAASETLRQSKVFTSLKVGKQWAIDALKLPAAVARDLTLSGLNRLRQLPDAALNRISNMSSRAKRWLLGCASDCKVELEAIKKRLAHLTDEDIERALAPIDPKRHAPPKKTKAEKAKKRAARGLPSIPVEDVVQEAIARLKARGVSGLPPREYGTRLHAVVREVVEETTGKAPKGWIAAAEQELGKVVKLRPENAGLTVREYMAKWGMTDRYPTFPDKFLDTPVEKLKPDLFVKAPDGRALVWDVTSRLDRAHLAKTMFYTEVIGRESGGFFRIAESYWRKVLTPAGTGG